MPLTSVYLYLLNRYLEEIEEGVEEDEDKEAGHTMERDAEAVDRRGEVDTTPYGP